ncbi:MAG TPA: VWA domain-containing protein [bacterium]|nr:VWA domain-containing protein [bacterium]HOZ21801.1 VWA domain-containing protein [bacterium]
MARDLQLRRADLIENPTARVPICLVLDNSPSMSGEIEMGSLTEQTNPRPIDELNAGLKLFIKELQEHEIARYSAEVAVVTFSSKPEQLVDFDSITETKLPAITVEEVGGTCLGTAVDSALKLLDRRKREYKDAGVDYFQPWLVIITDGRPTDFSHLEVAPRVADLVRSKKLTIFPIGVGKGSDLLALEMFSPSRKPLRLKELRFKEFFEWLSQSVTVVSQSMPGEAIKLPLDKISDWGTLD